MKHANMSRSPGQYSHVRDRALAGLAEHKAQGRCVASEIEHYLPRLLQELAEFVEKRLISPLAITLDLVDHARSTGIKLGPGRGADAASLLLWCLGITGIDPVRFGLKYQMFLSRPQLQLEVEWERRQHLLEYLEQKYGLQQIGQVAQQHSNKAGDAGGKYSVHAADIAISTQPISSTPLSVELFESETELRTGWPVYAEDSLRAEDVPVLTLLGNKNISVLALCESEDSQVDEYDAATLQAFRNGDTETVFFFSSSLARNILQQTKPQSFSDLCVLFAAIRPYHMNTGLIEELGRRMSSGNRDDAEVRELQEYLGDSYGLLLFQEQLVEILKTMCSCSYAEADEGRRTLGAKREADVLKIGEQLVCGAQGLGISKRRAEEIFSFIVHRSPLLLSKAHAVSYTWIAWQQAYCKQHRSL